MITHKDTLNDTKTDTVSSHPARHTVCLCDINCKHVFSCWLAVLNTLPHDDVIKWKHFPLHWPFVRGIHRSPVYSPHKGQWRGASIFSLIYAWTNCFANNREAGDLRRHRAHYAVTVMGFCLLCSQRQSSPAFYPSLTDHIYKRTKMNPYRQKSLKYVVDPQFLSDVISTLGSGDVYMSQQATGLHAWASRMKCPARFVSHLHEICIYIWVVYSLCFFCCLFITVTWWYVWCIEWASGNQEDVQACLVTLWLFIISATVYTKPL